MNKNFLLLTLLVSTQGFSFTKNKTYKFTILHTNDHHGRFWNNKDGEVGLAARATLINELRQEITKDGGEVLLLDAGDINTGIPQSDMLDAEPDFKGMKLLNYDVMAVGNHEFDNPLSVIRKQEEWAGFPFISANIFYENSDKKPFKGYVIKELQDLNIAILGLTTKDTPLKTNPLNVKGLVFKDPIEVARTEVPKLKKQSDILIALTHMGHYPNESHGSDAPGDVTLARQVNGIDIIVGGHTQLPVFTADIQNGAVIVQAGEWGKYVGRIDFEFLDGKLTLKNYKLIPVNLKKTEVIDGVNVTRYVDREITPDPVIESFLRPFKEQGDQLLQVVLAKSDGKFEGDRAVIRKQETNLGNLLALAYKEKFNADLSVLNSGGIRDSMPAGDITYETVLTVLPFGGEVVTVEISGNKLKTYLTSVALELAPGTGSYPQMSFVKIKGSRADKRIDEILINGQKIQDEKIYKIAIPEFIAVGGDKYPSLKNEPTFTKYGYTDADILKSYLEKVKTISVNDFAPTGYLDL